MLRFAAATALAALLMNGGEEVRTGVELSGDARILTGAESRLALTKIDRPGGLIEVRAVVTPNDGEVRTITLSLYDGEGTTLALPDQPDTHYRFTRKGPVVLASID